MLEEGVRDHRHERVTNADPAKLHRKTACAQKTYILDKEIFLFADQIQTAEGRRLNQVYGAA